MSNFVPESTSTEFIAACFEGRWSMILCRLPEWPELDESRFTRPDNSGRASGSIVVKP